MNQNAINQSRLEKRLLNQLKEALKVDLRIFFKSVRAENKKSIRKLGTYPTLSNKYTKKVEKILTKNHKKAIELFEKEVHKTLGIELTSEDKKKIKEKFLKKADKSAKKSAKSIIKTTRNNLQLAFSIALSQGNDEKKVKSFIETKNDRLLLIILSDKILEKLFSGRTLTIADVEAQTSSEAAKVEAGKQINEGLESGTIYKTWNTREDDRVRELHEELDNKKIEIDGLFETGGEKLSHPGDFSNGATAKNIVNCRCFLTYTKE